MNQPGLFKDRKRPAPLEAAAMASIKRYLAVRNIYHLRLNSGKIYRKGNWIHLCPEGTPDLFALYKGVALFVEVKREGEMPRDNQLVEHGFIRQSGGRVITAYAVEDVRNELMKIDNGIIPLNS